MATNWIQRILDRLGAPAGASISADIAAVEGETAGIAAIPTTPMLAANGARILCSMDFWSIPQTSVVLEVAPATETLPDVVVTGLPVGAVVVKATAMFKFRMLGNTGAANALDGDQHIGIQKAAGAFVTAISLVDNQFTIGAATREGGDVIIGDHNVVATCPVDVDATYGFEWTNAHADVADLTFYDLQVGLRIWYSV